MTEIKANSNVKIHVLADETLGGIKREYVEVDRKAAVGEKVIVSSIKTYNMRDMTVGSVYDVISGSGAGVTSVLVKDDVGDKACADHNGYHVLEPTDIVHIDGQRYEMADRKAKVGEKVITITKCDIYSKGEIGTVGYQSPPRYIYVRFETRAVAWRVPHEDYRVLVPLDKCEKTFENKNSGYKEIKNLIHNDLGITRQDIQEMISVAVSNEGQKLFESGKLDIIVGAKIDSLIEEGFRDGGRLLYGFKDRVSQTVSDEVGKRIAKVLNINVELKEERN
ncbi:hypothetical protein JF533_18820 [Bacillus subtilis]|uniref:hypothetical protein n=1 Tax=Brevibacillus laterosporus TaxID=1465 RepID=UPI00136429CD|nr:hypothetical protein [Brevibacillus laterosporus]MBG9809941.1 hypothetical protein [Bacillus subtilis]QMV49034.1 hypothetical protein Goe12_c01070 [Bacillus phage vB_BsuS-Goe12]QMV49214.1 hypothetical protein Goe13_c01130 [Bacillus phage vB_BsuS-Goe13]GIN80485.1 hypothetical protein J5TS4_10630 [Bacillus sp. J5TS4]MBG9786208.1 hypothetical protein [Brevibacillus laterosporus]